MTSVGTIGTGDSAIPGSCAAPFTSLRFEPDGRMTVCCVNGQYAVGIVGRDRIGDAWTGARLSRLREAIGRGDFGLGCMPCEKAHLDGRRHETEAAQFDRLVGDGRSPRPRRLEFALSNTCNLQCVQCNGELSSTIRAQREGRPPLVSPYTDEFFEELREYLPHVWEAAFLGGEPFLSRATMRVWDLLIELGAEPQVFVTTNGTVLNERVERYLRQLRMRIAVSVDAVTPELFESIRVGAEHATTFENIGRLRELTTLNGGELNVNTCIMRQNIGELPDILRWADGLDAAVRLIWVDYPRSMSLAAGRADELRRVLAALEARDAEMTSTLGRNAAVWAEAIRLLEALADAGEHSEAVSVQLAATNRGGASTPDPSEAAAHGYQRLADEHEEATARRGAVIEIEDDLVRAVDVPTWAMPLELDALVGESILRLLPKLSDRLGFDPTISMELVMPGLTLTHLHAAAPNWSADITSVLLEWTDGSRRLARIALFSASDFADL